jgi:hypothetical protein
MFLSFLSEGGSGLNAKLPEPRAAIPAVLIPSVVVKS